MRKKMSLGIVLVVLFGLALGFYFGNLDYGTQVAEKTDIVDKVNESTVNNDEFIWHTSFKEAYRISQESNLPILLLFTAPDSCVYCKKLEDEILSKEEFKVWAKENVVLFVANFSDLENEALMLQNNFLAEKFKIKGYPSTVILSYSEKENKLFGLQNVAGYGENWFEVVKTTVEKLK